MREILFRGKREDNGEWVDGFYSQFHNRPILDEPNSHQIFELIDKGVKIFGTSIGGFWHIIDPETIGQFTGLTDKHGKKIFEDDIVKCKDYLEAKPLEFQGYIDFKNGSYVIVGDFMTHYRWLDYEVEVIGNIHDNPELLKEGAIND